MNKEITVKDLISNLNRKSLTYDRDLKDVLRLIKYDDYDSTWINGIAKQVVTNAHIKDDKLWINTNKEQNLTDTAFILNFTNIDINPDDAVIDYNLLISYKIMDEIKESYLYKLFYQAVINARNDLIRNDEISYHNIIEIFVNILSKSINEIINITNDNLSNVNLNEMIDNINIEE